MIFRRLLILFLFASVLFPESARATLFKDPIQLTANVGTPFDIDLHTLLINPSLTDVAFSASTDLPGWLTLGANSHLTGTPTASSVGSVVFHLSAVQGESGDLNHPATITVYGPPVWNQNPLNLGTLTVGTPLSVNLASDVTNASGGALTFTVSGTMPSWLSLTP